MAVAIALVCAVPGGVRSLFFSVSFFLIFRVALASLQ